VLWPDFQRAGPWCRPCSDFQNRQRPYGGVHSHGPCAGRSPHSPFIRISNSANHRINHPHEFRLHLQRFHVPFLIRPLRPLTRPLSSSANGDQTLPVPPASQLEPPGRSNDLLAATPAGVALAGPAGARAAKSWATGSAGFPCERQGPAAAEEDLRLRAPIACTPAAMVSGGRPELARGGVAGAGPRCQGRSAHRFADAAGLGATLPRLVPPSTPCPRHWWPGCGPWAGGLQSPAGHCSHPTQCQRNETRSGWPARARTAYNHNSVHQPEFFTARVFHQPTRNLSEATFEPFARAAPVGVLTSALLDSRVTSFGISSALAEKDTDRAGLLQVCSPTCDPHPRGVAINALGLAVEGTPPGATEPLDPLELVCEIGGHRSDADCPSAGCAVSAGPRTAQAVRPVLWPAGGRRFDLLTATPWGCRGIPDVAALISALIGGGGRGSVKVPPASNTGVSDSGGIPPWVGGRVLLLRELPSPASSPSGRGGTFCPLGRRRWPESTLFVAEEGRTETLFAGLRLACVAFSRSACRLDPRLGRS